MLLSLWNPSRRIFVVTFALVFLTFVLFALSRNNSDKKFYVPNTDSSAESLRILADKAVYRIAVVTDLDLDSKDTSGSQTFWKSYLRYATLSRDVKSGTYSVVFDNPMSSVVLRSRFNLDGRSMELSWLTAFNGNLYTGDDRGGIVYSIDGNKAHARFILPDGDGTEEKGFKSEWATVKNNALYVGSFGKEWSTDSGEILNHNPQWIKVIDRHGGVSHVDWSYPFEQVRRASGYGYPGYLFHEAVAWNEYLRRWFFVPRRASTQKYNAEADELMGANLIISTDDKFADTKIVKIDVDMDAKGNNPKGYAEIRFVPGQPRDIVALRTLEHKGVTKSWISVFNVDGNVLMHDEFIDNFKFEGLEFMP